MENTTVEVVMWASPFLKMFKIISHTYNVLCRDPSINNIFHSHTFTHMRSLELDGCIVFPSIRMGEVIGSRVKLLLFF